MEDFVKERVFRKIMGILIMMIPGALFAQETVGVSAINSGDTAWVLISAALVLMMTVPALAMFYAGMVRLTIWSQVKKFKKLIFLIFLEI